MSSIQRVVFITAAVAYAAIGTGCIAMGSAQKADTLGKGHVQFGIEPGVIGGAVQGTFGVLPDFNAAVRFGITDTIDLGLRAGTTLLEVQTKFLLTDPLNDSLAISLAPSINGIYLGFGGAGASTGGGMVNVQIPALVGIKFGSGSELVVGPRINNMMAFGTSTVGTNSSSLVYQLTAGASLGVALQLTDFFGLMPEVSFMVPLVTTARASSGSASGGAIGGPGQGVAFGFHLNFLLGRGRTAEAAPTDLPPPPPPPAPLPPPPAAP